MLLDSHRDVYVTPLAAHAVPDICKLHRIPELMKAPQLPIQPTPELDEEVRCIDMMMLFDLSQHNTAFGLLSATLLLGWFQSSDDCLVEDILQSELCQG